MIARYAALGLSTILPLSRDLFADPVHGGFHEQLRADGTPVPVGSKRLMVQCRQLYVLAEAALQGDRSGTGAAERGYDFLRSAYADPVHGGWYFRAATDGVPVDRTKDLYTHAFVLFALAHLHRAFAAPDALALAEDTYAELRQRLAAPGGGFWDAASEDWQPVRGQRRQNPHMHLLEALHALHEATAEEYWLDEARMIVALFRDRFFDPATSTLGEHFHDDWTPHEEHGHKIEAGHHFEWVWLLHRHAALVGRPGDPAADALFDTALRHGFDPEHGGIHDAMDRAGRPIERTRRIWPVTEAIKAYVARLEAGREVPDGEPGRTIGHLFRHFLEPAERGWIERLSREGDPTQTTLPGSTPYHLMLAAAEVRRVLGERPG